MQSTHGTADERAAPEHKNRRSFFLLATALAAMASGRPAQARSNPSDARLNELEQRVSNLTRQLERAEVRGAVENIFSRYQYLHCAFRDAEIITELWVKPGTPGISAEYTNTGVYTTWDSVMAYHRNRPSPVGKLLVHCITTPLVEVAEDGQTAKGVWTVAGIESGMSDPEVAAKAPKDMFEAESVEGKKVWVHWIWCRYAIDFLKQDGEWRIWHFRCVEIARAPFSKNWIAFASEMEANESMAKFHTDLAYFGDDGKPVFMPPVDGPPKSIAYSYRTDRSMQLEPALPKPYRTIADSFAY